MQKKHYLVLLTFFLMQSCQISIQKKWINANLYQRDQPMVIDFSEDLAKIYNFQFQAETFGYKIADSILILKQFFDEKRFIFHQPNKDSLVLKDLFGDQVLHLVSFEKKFKNRKKRQAFFDKNSKKIGEEKVIIDLLQALQAPTVEQRVRNLLNEFKEGDYISTETIFILMGISPMPHYYEREDVEKQRSIVRRIEKISKQGNNFEVFLVNELDIESELPIYQERGLNSKPTSVLDLKIHANARAKITVLEKNGIKIDIDGVKVGKGWLKIGIPAMIITGNMGKLMGFQFSLVR